MARLAVSYVIFGFFLIIHTTETLMCYQCADTAYDTPCVNDMEGFLNTSLGIEDIYSKNCTDSNPRWDRCVIETYKEGGKTSLFKRGCHDGVTFNKHETDKEFENLTSNNDTTCAYNGKGVICFTFCDQSDYCNGPQPNCRENKSKTENNSRASPAFSHLSDLPICDASSIFNGCVICSIQILGLLSLWVLSVNRQ